MDRKEIKEQIIQIVKSMEGKIGKEKLGALFAKDNGNDKNIGCNQFRDLASTCRQADCYEEIELLVQYSTAKAKSGQSWKTSISGGQTFGKLVVDCMQKVRKIDPTHAQEMYLLELFFGYLYWQSRIWSETDSPTQNNRGNKQQYGNSYSNFKNAGKRGR